MPNTSIEYFDRMYTERDPWDYESSWYEQRKYAITLAALGRPRYGRSFEPGCSIGVLTSHLAQRCDELLATDFHPGALGHARHRLASQDHVRVEHLEVPRQWPEGTFDLIVISELAYYLDEASHAALIDQTCRSLTPAGEVVLVHWRGETDYPLTGDQVHERWRSDPRLEVSASHMESAFRLDVVHPRTPLDPPT